MYRRFVSPDAQPSLFQKTATLDFGEKYHKLQVNQYMEGGPLFPYFAIDKSFVRSLNICNFISAVAKAFALL